MVSSSLENLIDMVVEKGFYERKGVDDNSDEITNICRKA